MTDKIEYVDFQGVKWYVEGEYKCQPMLSNSANIEFAEAHGALHSLWTLDEADEDYGPLREL